MLKLLAYCSCASNGHNVLIIKLFCVWASVCSNDKGILHKLVTYCTQKHSYTQTNIHTQTNKKTNVHTKKLPQVNFQGFCFKD